MNHIFTKEHLQDCLCSDDRFAFGIFEKQTNELLSRCMRSNGDITALQTVQKARGKGYAKLLIKKVSKTLAELSIQPFAYADLSNKSSISVFHSVGYKNLDTNAVIVYIQPICTQKISQN